MCSTMSSGTALPILNSCTCQCLPNVPTYREDLRKCVDDIQGENKFLFDINSTE